MNQLDLTFTPPKIRKVDALNTLSNDDAFVMFHRANPEVFHLARKLAHEMKAAGWEHASINLIFERMRWLHAIHTQGDAYKLNNNYRAYYARTLMVVDPVLAGFFRVREQRGTWEPNLGLLGLIGEQQSAWIDDIKRVVKHQVDSGAVWRDR